MSVQRYEFELYHCNGGDMVISETGDFVSHDDYAALEAKYAALAAENAAMKAAAKETLAHWAAAEPGEMEQMMDKCMPSLRVSYCETPVTDSFLAEVRASAVDEACLKISNAIVYCYQDEQIGLDAAAAICGDFAAQLRQGAAQ